MPHRAICAYAPIRISDIFPIVELAGYALIWYRPECI